MSVSHDSTGLSVMSVILPLLGGQRLGHLVHFLLATPQLSMGTAKLVRPAAKLPRMTDARLPDPAMVVLAGAAGSGKSTWAAERFRTAEVVSSDALRAAVGSGPSDLEATVEAFALLDQIVAARSKRSLTTVIDTLGLDPERRADYQRSLARPDFRQCS